MVNVLKPPFNGVFLQTVFTRNSSLYPSLFGFDFLIFDF